MTIEITRTSCGIPEAGIVETIPYDVSDRLPNAYGLVAETSLGEVLLLVDPDAKPDFGSYVVLRDGEEWIARKMLTVDSGTVFTKCPEFIHGRMSMDFPISDFEKSLCGVVVWMQPKHEWS